MIEIMKFFSLATCNHRHFATTDILKPRRFGTADILNPRRKTPRPNESRPYESRR